MIEYKLRPVTETSWILLSNGNRLAMIISDGNGYKAIGNLPHKKFDNLEHMAEILGGKIEFEEIIEEVEPETSFVEGYPIKHANSYDILNNGYPSYTRISGGQIRFAAGYYSILFANGWSPVYCPKTVTLEENQWIGPFRTKLEMRSAISAKKREIKI
jgi:hypothetical protein